ncbi:MAG: transcriptional repressor LexA [Phycisphaerae bacterium]|nr:transcriptional repressor LexA [Phycisphaerae bacterium]
MSKEPTVTPRQLEILRLIRDGRRQNGFSPTMQEIGDRLHLSKVTVFEHVEALVAKGLLHRGSQHKARSLRIADDLAFPDERPTRIPLVGRVAAGQPIEAIEDRQILDLEDVFAAGASGETFVLQVTGDSMIDEHIADGDYVICRRGKDVRNGETVVALLDNGEATLKKFYRERGRIRLQPANPAFKPIYARDVDIQGVVVGVVRKM